MIWRCAFVLLAAFATVSCKQTPRSDEAAPIPGHAPESQSDEIRKEDGAMDPDTVETSAGGKPVEPHALPMAIRSKVDGATMVLVPGGAFIYGINHAERVRIMKTLSNASLPIFELEFARVTRHLASYYIDRTEVTNHQYGRFIRAAGHRAPAFWRDGRLNSPEQPVVGVGWSDARAYAEWAGKRLPSEEEWEKAARGTDGRIWPWGDVPAAEKYNGRGQGNLRAVNVGSYPEGASPCGALDMAGNVYEMTTGSWGTTGWAMRGGCFLNAAAYTRTMFRWSPADTSRGASWLGFRCVMDTSTAVSPAQSAVHVHCREEDRLAEHLVVEQLQEAGRHDQVSSDCSIGVRTRRNAFTLASTANSSHSGRRRPGGADQKQLDAP